MIPSFRNKNNAGFTLIEIVVAVFILAILAFSVSQLFLSMIKGITYFRERTTISSLADQYLEIARNIPYSQIGTMAGNPPGSLPDEANPLVVNFGGVDYKIYYVVRFIDDPADGTAPNDTDYKQVKLYVQNAITGSTNSFLTNISPKGLEGLENGGALAIKVFDAVGQPIGHATVHITNSQVNLPNGLDLIDYTDDSGNVIEVGLPDSANSYHIVATKTCSPVPCHYSLDQTYPITEGNPNPTKPDATILNGQITSVSFAIDQLSNLTFNTLSQTCQPITSQGMDIKGSKLIGTPPDVYKFDNTYTSDSGGKISLPNVEWDGYLPTPTGSSYMIYGSSPSQQITVFPNTNQDFDLILGPKTSNSLLVLVKDGSTGNPVEGAQIDLQASSPPSSFAITASVGANGTISPSGTISANRGDSKTFEITSDSGYSVKDVSVDGSSVGPVTDHTFENISSDHAIVASFTPSIAWLSGWQHRKKITISNTNVDSDLADFPVLVKVSSDSSMSSALSTGYDIRFTDATGNALLQYERESWSGGNGSAVTANFWVKVPVISHSSATTIYIYYGNASASTDWTVEGTPTNAQLVWDSNYAAVWHLPNGTALSANDSTAGVNTGSASNVSAIAGQIDGGASYPSSSSYRRISITSPSSVLQNLGNGNYTFETWLKPSSYVASSYINYMNGEGLVETKSSKYGIVHSKNVVAVSSATVSTSSFTHLVGTKSGTSYNIYINGSVSNGTLSNDTGYDSYYTIGGGKGQQTSKEFLGIIDEVRVSDSVRSDDWIKFEYHNMTDADNDLTFAGQETEIVTYTITASAGLGGTITPAGSISVDSGTNQLFIITPNQGYHILDVTVDESPMGAIGSYTFSNLTSDHTISATFEATLIVGGYIDTKYTAGSIWSQNDWSGGSGQVNFVETNKYFSDDGNVGINGTPSGLRLMKNGSFYVPSAWLISSTFDTGTNSTTYTNLVWEPTSQDPSTEVKFQIATSNCSNGATDYPTCTIDPDSWSFVGPNGTSDPNDVYSVPGTTTNSANNNNRYIRYKVFLSTTDDSITPVLTSIGINYVSGCFTPGQAMFAGLQGGEGYQVTVTMPDYQTQIISNIKVDGYNVLQVSLQY